MLSQMWKRSPGRGLSMGTLRGLIDELIRAEDCVGNHEAKVSFNMTKGVIEIEVKDDNPIHVGLEIKEKIEPILTDVEIEHIIRHVEGFGGIFPDRGFWVVGDQAKANRIVAGLYTRLCKRTGLDPYKHKGK